MINDIEVKRLLYHILSSCISCCIYHEKYSKKKNNMRESGYIVDLPIDYSSSEYGSIRTHGFWDVKTYYKYGLTYHLEENDTYSISKTGYVLPEALKQDQKRRKKRYK